MKEPNILLVVLDSVRAANTSIHDHRHDTTPELATLATEATTYTQARSPDRWSLPSHASLFTGLSTPEHDLTEKGDRLEAGHSVFTSLHEAGYATGLFSENPFLTELETGLDDGFETVEGTATEPLFSGAVNPGEFVGDPVGFLRAALQSRRPAQSILNGISSKLAWDYPGLLPDAVQQRVSGGVSRGEKYTDRFLEWSNDCDGPWAACINYMDAHHPFEPRSEHDLWADDSVAQVLADVSPYPGGFYSDSDSMWRCEIAEFRYDGAIRQADHEVGRLIRALRRRDELSDTLVVVTSDHGDGFGDRSRLRPVRIAGHAVGAHEVNLHVPLVVKYPGQTESRRYTEPVSLTEFPDAVRVAREGAAPDKDPFVSEEPIIAVGSHPDEEFLERLRAAGKNVDPFRGDVKVAYEATSDRGVRKHVRWAGRRRTFNVVDAQTTVTAEESEVEDIIEQRFADLSPKGVCRSEGITEVDESTKQRLSELGYR